jgi:hypothetical protein
MESAPSLELVPLALYVFDNLAEPLVASQSWHRKSGFETDCPLGFARQTELCV